MLSTLELREQAVCMMPCEAARPEVTASWPAFGRVAHFAMDEEPGAVGNRAPGATCLLLLSAA